MAFNGNAFAYISAKEFGVTGDGVTDDAPAIQRALNTLFGLGFALWFPAGTYLFNSTVTIPSGGRILGSADAILLGNIVGLFPLAGSIFRAGISGGPVGATTIAAPGVVQGSRTIPVTSTAGATVGGFAALSNVATGNRQSYRVEAIGVGSITVDRPIIAKPFVAGNAVNYYNANQLPQNIVIHGNGMKVRGKAVVTISLQTAWNCEVDGLVFDTGTGTNPSDACFGFNNACYNCVASNLYADMTGGGAPSVCFAPESSEACEFYNCTAIGATGAGMGFINSFQCLFIGCHAENCNGGFEWSNDITPNNGSDYCSCIDCWAIGNVNNGFDIGDNSQDAACIDCNANYNGNTGFAVEAGTIRASISGKAIGNTASAVFVIAGAKFTQIPSLHIADNAGIALNLADDCSIGVLSGSSKAVVAASIFLMTGGIVSIANVDISRRTGGTAAFLFTVNAGRLSLGRGQVLCGTTGDVCFTTNGGVLLTGAVQCTAVDAAAATFGVFAPAGTIRIQDGFNADGCATPVLATAPGVTNRLQVVANGTTPVVVPWVDLKSTDRVTLTLLTASPAPPVLLGTPQVTYNPGVGFTVTGMQTLDASTYDAVVG